MNLRQDLSSSISFFEFNKSIAILSALYPSILAEPFSSALAITLRQSKAASLDSSGENERKSTKILSAWSIKADLATPGYDLIMFLSSYVEFIWIIISGSFKHSTIFSKVIESIIRSASSLLLPANCDKHPTDYLLSKVSLFPRSYFNY